MNRSFGTYQARLCAHQRLAKRNNAWNAALIALATSTTIASIGLLVDKTMYGAGGDALMVSLAVLSLVASLIVSNANYSARARAMEGNYKRIQQISLAAEREMRLGGDPGRIDEIQQEYNVTIDSSENHSTADYIRSGGKSVTHPRFTLAKDIVAGSAPYLALTAPIALVVPFAMWFYNGL